LLGSGKLHACLILQSSNCEQKCAEVLQNLNNPVYEPGEIEIWKWCQLDMIQIRLDKKMLSSYYKNPTVCIKNQLVTAFGHTYENKYNVFKSFIYI